jgi:hypothetical protein
MAECPRCVRDLSRGTWLLSVFRRPPAAVTWAPGRRAREPRVGPARRGPMGLPAVAGQRGQGGAGGTGGAPGTGGADAGGAGRPKPVFVAVGYRAYRGRSLDLGKTWIDVHTEGVSGDNEFLIRGIAVDEQQPYLFRYDRHLHELAGNRCRDLHEAAGLLLAHDDHPPWSPASRPRYARLVGVRPSFWFFPPHCLKKNGTRARRHCSRMSTTHDGFIGRGLRPDSPPTMTQSMPRMSRSD